MVQRAAVNAGKGAISIFGVLAATRCAPNLPHPLCLHRPASQLGRPHVEVPPAPALPKEASLVAGAAGQSCDVACAAKQMTCRAEWFLSINDCNSLRAKFMCEAGGLGTGWCAVGEERKRLVFCLVLLAPDSAWPPGPCRRLWELRCRPNGVPWLCGGECP